MATRVARRDRDERDERNYDDRGRDDRDRDERPRRDYDDEPPRSSRSDRRDERDNGRGRTDGLRDDDDRGRGRERDDYDDRPRSARDDDRDRPSRDERDERPRFRGARDDDRDRDTRDDRPRSSSRDDGLPPGVGMGWSGSKRMREQARQSNMLKLSETHVLLKFLFGEPYMSFIVHWVGPPGRGTPHNCPGEQTCDLHAYGHKGTAYDLWPVVQIATSDDDPNEPPPTPQLKMLQANPTMTDEIAQKDQARSGPITNPYYEAYSTGGGKDSGPPTYHFDTVRERDVDAEWHLDPLTEQEIDKFLTQLPKRSELFTPASRDDLRKAARELRDRD